MYRVVRKKIGGIGGDGGMIGIDKNSNISIEFNTPGDELCQQIWRKRNFTL